MRNNKGYIAEPNSSEDLSGGDSALETVPTLVDHKQALDALGQREQEFRAVFNSALDAMLVADDMGNYIDANSAACELFGVSKEELLNSKLADFVEPGRKPETQQSWQSFLEQGEQKGIFP